jgi:cytochrome c5
MTTPYDCTADVMAHKAKVERIMRDFARQLEERAACHDDSKLKTPEKELFDQWTPELKQRTFGTDYYKQALDGMGEGIQHHYRANRHHPEHFEIGVYGMTLVDVVEMFCDWCAAAEGRGVPVDLDNGAKRFHISEQLTAIFANTVKQE